ncbi:hypothetical protein OESDEN_03822 [Oesophagostomum dentatum]|uniref:Uncharacterized protein n=1 Tax=Oesophagostomum dentatum TaxID=61180 RepID=A0A0B1TLF2_OESDE|nr:hypothetical protein OESDEN_03822 [Oesophagostomum dentatum]
MTTANPQRQRPPLQKFSTETRPAPLLRRDERIRSMTNSFEEITESEEEHIQLPEQSRTEGRSPFAISVPSSLPQRRVNSPQSLNPKLAEKFPVPRLCRGFSDPIVRRRATPSCLFTLSPDRNEADLLTLPPIPEGVTSSSS